MKTYDELVKQRDEAYSQLEKANEELSFLQYRCEICKFIAQGETCCKCFNPKQDNADLKGYVYIGFGCRWFEKGDRLTEEEMNKNGFEKIIDETKSIKEFFAPK